MDLLLILEADTYFNTDLHVKMFDSADGVKKKVFSALARYNRAYVHTRTFVPRPTTLSQLVITMTKSSTFQPHFK